MTFGICTKNIDLLQKSNSDFAELHFAMIATMPQAEFDALKQAILDAKITVQSANGMLPGNVRLYEREEKEDFGLSEFLHTGYARMQAVGGKFVVIGSGSQRAYPEGETKELGMARFARFVKFASEIAAQYGICNVIEPLNKKETNIVYTVLDGAEICKLAGYPKNLGVLADLYHVAQEEPIEDILQMKDLLWHCHISAPSDRKTPLPGDGSEAQCIAFLTALHQIGYRGGVSWECIPRDSDADYGTSIAYIKRLLQKIQG